MNGEIFTTQKDKGKILLNRKKMMKKIRYR